MLYGIQVAKNAAVDALCERNFARAKLRTKALVNEAAQDGRQRYGRGPAPIAPVNTGHRTQKWACAPAKLRG